MTRLRLNRLVAFLLLLPVAIQVQGCWGPVEPVRVSETVNVSLRNTDTFEYPTVGGDEEGATISKQATHHSISEIRRDAETNWIAVYVYRPAAGFVGSDHAEIEVHTGSDGASPTTHIRTVIFRFEIHD
jgi:hypothetical protein